MIIFFYPTKDPAARTHMSQEIVVAILTTRSIFFKTDFPLPLPPPSTSPPAMLFNLALLTLTSHQQILLPPTAMGTDNGAADYVQEVIDNALTDTAGGFCLPPWITPQSLPTIKTSYRHASTGATSSNMAIYSHSAPAPSSEE